MTLIAKLLIAFVALEHLYILWLEMFAWTTAGEEHLNRCRPICLRKQKSMAANQGLYNGFLAAGLIWSLIIQDEPVAECGDVFGVLIAGIYGAISVQKSIFYVQGIPATIALAAVIFL